MSKVFGMHPIALHPGVLAEDFEKFAREEMIKTLCGQSIFILKADRGDRKGYLLMVEFSSQEARDRLYPAHAPPSYELQRAISDLVQILEKWASMATPFHFTVGTDYVVLE